MNELNRMAMEKLSLSARAYNRILKVAEALASSFLLVFGIKFLVKENIPPWGVGENKKRNIRLFHAVKPFYF